MSMPPEERYLADLHREVREELVRVDAKIGILFRAFLVTVGVVVAGMIAGEWDPGQLATPAQAVWWAGAVAAGVALVRLLLALSPRTVHSRPPSHAPRYFGDVADFATVDDLTRALSGGSTFDRLADQTHELAKLTRSKYSTINAANVFYVLGVALCLVAVAAG